MRIFYVCRRVPFPPDRGDKIAAFNTIRHLAARHEVHVFCLGDGAQDVANISGLQCHVNSIIAAPVTEVTIKLRALNALATGSPLSVAALNEGRLHRAIQQKFTELRPDLVIVYSCNMAQFAKHLPDVPRIMHFGDLDSMKWQLYAEQSPPPSRWIYSIEGRRLLAYERQIAHDFSHALVHTEAEKRDFERLIPGVPVSVVSNGVDLDYFRPAGAIKQPGSLVFTGVMDYRPNVDAVAWFCNEILPIVQAEIPDSNFTICGSRPTRAVRRLARRRGITVTGWVPDARPYLDRAAVFVAPLRMARGVQNKLLEALAMGLPCVASMVASRGTLVAEDDGVLVSDDPRTFASHVVDLLRDGGRRVELARRARAAAEANYRWEDQLSRLDQVVATLVSRPLRRTASASAN
ncbi:MAG: TIGR03087 family PEP-CTERM/XrtA system glycosyltransferase [Alphaproteobacteria bacterium]|nr:TIGR03087 family PEP-CTERM/XrtA system glycosyltransferase [Alphaproteobacteria bacterium]